MKITTAEMNKRTKENLAMIQATKAKPQFAEVEPFKPGDLMTAEKMNQLVDGLHEIHKYLGEEAKAAEPAAGPVAIGIGLAMASGSGRTLSRRGFLTFGRKG